MRYRVFYKSNSENKCRNREPNIFVDEKVQKRKCQESIDSFFMIGSVMKSYNTRRAVRQKRLTRAKLSWFVHAKSSSTVLCEHHPKRSHPRSL